MTFRIIDTRTFFYVGMVLAYVSFVMSQSDEFGRIKNSTCETEQQCEKYNHAYCYSHNTYCKCHPGFGPIYRIDKTTCEKLATKLGDTCEFQEQCQLNLGMDSTCSEGKCICRNETVFQPKNDYCYHENASIYSCNSNSDCNGEECDTSFCKCRNLKIMRKLRGTFNCLDVSDTHCVIDEQCKYSIMGMDSKCKGGTCECTDKFTPDNNKVCVKKLNEECQNDSDCIYNTCRGKCICPSDETMLKIDEQCSRYINDSHCDTVCHCNTTFVEANGTCFKVSEKETLGSSCKIDQQCSLNFSVCNNTICACKSGYHEKDKQCFQTSTYNTSCNETNNCNFQNGICKANICECENEKTFVKESKECKELASSNLIYVLSAILICVIIVVGIIIVARKKFYPKQFQNIMGKRNSFEDSPM